MYDILMAVHNTTCETDFEKEFISMKVTKDKRGNLVVVTETGEPSKRFPGFQDVVRRRFYQPDGLTVKVEVEDGGEWIPEENFEKAVEISV